MCVVLCYVICVRLCVVRCVCRAVLCAVCHVYCMCGVVRVVLPCDCMSGVVCVSCSV